MRKLVKGLIFGALLILMTLTVSRNLVSAESFADPLFQAKWNTLDLPVAQGKASYSWVYGPTPGAIKTEVYAEAPNQRRLVQYFDKARMELTRRADNPNAVTAGLLTVELVSGNRQEGDAVFVPDTPAQVPVAGDSDDQNGPTYASFTKIATLPGSPPHYAAKHESHPRHDQSRWHGQSIYRQSPGQCGERLLYQGNGPQHPEHLH